MLIMIWLLVLIFFINVERSNEDAEVCREILIVIRALPRC